MFLANPQIFIGDLTKFFGDPRFSLEISIFSFENPSIFGRPQDFHWRPPNFYWRPYIFIGDPNFGFNNKKLGFKLRVLIENIWGLQWKLKIVGLKQTFWVSNKNLGGLQWKSWIYNYNPGVSNKIMNVSKVNLGSPMNFVGSLMKIWGSRCKACGLQW